VNQRMSDSKDVQLQGTCSVSESACTLRLELTNESSATIWALYLDPGGSMPWAHVQAAGSDAVFVAFARPKTPWWMLTAQPIFPTGLPLARGERLAFDLVLALPLTETALASRAADPLAGASTVAVHRILVGLEVVLATARGTPFRHPGGGHAVAALAKTTGVAWAWIAAPSPLVLLRLPDTRDELGNPPHSMVDHLLAEDLRRIR